MSLDLAHRQAARVKADDLVVETVQTRHALRHQDGFERAGPIARNGKRDRAVLGQHGFGGMTVPAVASGPHRRRRTLLIAKMVCQFVAQQVLRGRYLGEQLVQQLGLYCRHLSSLSLSQWDPTAVYTKELTLSLLE